MTGGTKGFGFTVGLWLAAQGAGRVILASRSGETGGVVVREIARAREAGAEIEIMQLNVTDGARVESVVKDLADDAKPLRGIVHAAVDYDDAMLPDIAPPSITRVLAPKVTGAMNLTRAVSKSGANLDFLVSFSSLAQTVGWPGQVGYAAANAFLEACARYQRTLGIPGQCLNWGALGQSGAVARSGAMTTYLESAGWRTVEDREALSALGAALGLDAPVLTYAAVDWGRLLAGHAPLSGAPRLKHLQSGEGGRLAGGLRALLAGQGGEGIEAAKRLVSEEVAKVLRIEAAELAQYETLDDAGLDSLSTFELRNRLESATGLSVPLGGFTQAASIPDLAELLCRLAAELADDRPDSDPQLAAEAKYAAE